MIPIPITEPFKYMMGGSNDANYGPFADVAEANSKILNTVDGNGVPFRKDKTVKLQSDGNEYVWVAPYGNNNLVRKAATKSEADNALAAANTADGKAVIAKNTADGAVTSAANAATAAATADGKAISAQDTADAALDYAEIAQAWAEQAQLTADQAKIPIADFFTTIVTGDAISAGTVGSTFIEARSNNIPIPFSGILKKFKAYAHQAGTGFLRFEQVVNTGGVTTWNHMFDSPVINVPPSGEFEISFNTEINVTAGWVYAWKNIADAKLAMGNNGWRSNDATNGGGVGKATFGPTSAPLMSIAIQTIKTVKATTDALQTQVTAANTVAVGHDARLAITEGNLSTGKINYWPYIDHNFGTTDYVTNTYAAITSGTKMREWVCYGNEPVLAFPQFVSATYNRRIRITNIANFTTNDKAYFQCWANMTNTGSSKFSVWMFWTDDNNVVVGVQGTKVRNTLANVFQPLVAQSPPWPVGATRLWLAIDAVNLTLGDIAEFGVFSITKNYLAPYKDNPISVADIALGRRALLCKTQSIVYRSPNGDDTTGTGSLVQPVNSLARALALVKNNGRIHCLYGSNGTYTDVPTNFTPAPMVEITSDYGVKVKCGTRITSTWTKTAGRNFIYQTPFTFGQSDLNLHKIYEETSDPASIPGNLISAAERHGIMGNSKYRLPFWVINRAERPNENPNGYQTAGVLTDSLNEIDASPIGKPLFYYDYVNSILYLVTSDRTDPSNKTLMLPAQSRYYIGSSAITPTQSNAGFLRWFDLEVWYAGIGPFACPTEWHNPKVYGGFGDGLYPHGDCLVYNLWVGAVGNDGCSPHDWVRLWLFGFWAFLNWDEGLSTHYKECYAHIENFLIEDNQHGGAITPAYGSQITGGNGHTRGHQRGGGGITILGDATDVTTVDLFNVTSENDIVGFDDRSANGILNLRNCKALYPTTQGYKNVNKAIDCGITAGSVVGTFKNTPIQTIPV